MQDLAYFSVYCVSVRFRYAVPGNGVRGEREKVACKIDIRGGVGVGDFLLFPCLLVSFV